MTQDKGSSESSDEEIATSTLRPSTTPYIDDVNNTSTDADESELPETFETDIQDTVKTHKQTKLREEVTKLQSISDIIKLMTNPDEVKIDMTPEEIGAFQVWMVFFS